MKIIYFYDSEKDKTLFADNLKKIGISKNVFYSDNKDEVYLRACSGQYTYLFVNIVNSKQEGLLFCQKIRKNCKNIFVIVINNDKQLAFDCLKIGVSGYIIYPFNISDICFEMEKLGKSLYRNIYIKTFGHFDVFINGDAIHFKNAKSKEFLALLIDKEGSIITMDYAITYLWPNRKYDHNVKSRYRAMLKDLRETLMANRIYDIITERRNSRSINRTAFTCDYYGILQGDPKCIDRFNNNYMFEYSWSENTLTKINNILKDRKDKYTQK